MPIPEDGIVPDDPQSVIDAYLAKAQADVDAAQLAVAASQARLARATADLAAKQDTLNSYLSYPAKMRTD